MTTITSRIQQSTDDANQQSSGLMDLAVTYVSVGAYTARDMGLRFTQNISGLSGATIDAGTKLTFRAHLSDTGSFIGDWYAEDAAAPSTFTSTNSDITDRTRTTATCEGDKADFGSWTSGSDHDFVGDGTTEIQDIIQELADDYDPSAIILLWIYTSGAGERVAVSYDNDTATAALLTIVYTAATGAQTISPDAVTMPVAVPAPTLSFGTATISPDPVAVTLQIPVPVVNVAPITISPDPVVLTLNVGPPTVLIGQVISPDAIAIPLVVPSVSLSFGTATLTPDAVAVVLAVPTPVVSVTGGIAFDTYKEAREIDFVNYGTGIQFHLAVVLRTTNAVQLARARLFNITNGEAIAASEVTTTSTTFTHLISSAFSLPTKAHTYRVEVGGQTGGEYICTEAAVIARTA